MKSGAIEARSARSGPKGFRDTLIERFLTAARAPCSYLGCTRRRHTGPCTVTSSRARRREETRTRPVARTSIYAEAREHS